MQKRTKKILFGALDLHAFQDNEIIITMTLFKLEIYILRLRILRLLMLGPLKIKFSGLIGHHIFMLNNYLLYNFQL